MSFSPKSSRQKCIQLTSVKNRVAALMHPVEDDVMHSFRWRQDRLKCDSSVPGGEGDGSEADNAPMETPEAGPGVSESLSSSLDDSSHPPGVVTSAGVPSPKPIRCGDPALSTIAANEAEASYVTRLHSSVSAAAAHWARLDAGAA
eukprot:506118-Prymnesium_polylepis.2